MAQQPDVRGEERQHSPSLSVNPYPCEIGFQDVHFSVHQKDGAHVAILQGVSGFIRSCRLTACMGASGAGKSTLLKVLACNIAGGELQGRLLVDGLPVVAREFRRQTAVVWQSDVLLATATVKEALMTSALLKLPQSMPVQRKEERVEQILQELELQHVKDSLIGEDVDGAVSGISGGERRRVSVGIGLVTDARALFLDEPTTGLDSDSAEGLISLLSHLARSKQRTVMCTIHQPSSDICERFDNLLLLSCGRVMYCGAWARADAYFLDSGYPRPGYRSTAEHLLTVCKDRQRAVPLLATAYEARVRQAEALQAHESHGSSGKGGGQRLPTPRRRASPAKPPAAAQDVEANVPGSASPASLPRPSPRVREGVAGSALDWAAAGRDSPRRDSPRPPKHRITLWAETPAAGLAREASDAAERARALQGAGGSGAGLRVATTAPHSARGGKEGGAVGSPSEEGWASPSRAGPMFATPPTARDEVATSHAYQVWVLSARFLRSWYRSPINLAVQAGQYLFFALLIGTTYLRLSHQASSGVFDRVASLWFVGLSVVLQPGNNACTIFYAQKPLLRRELTNGLYHYSSFFLAKSLTSLPFQIVFAAIFNTTVYFLTGYQTDVVKFFIFFGILLLTLLISETLGILCAGLHRSTLVGLIILAIAYLPLLMFTGFIQTETPVYFAWIKRVSYVSYAYAALVKNEFSGLQLYVKGWPRALPDSSSLVPANIENHMSITADACVLLAILVLMRVAAYLQGLVALRMHWL